MAGRHLHKRTCLLNLHDVCDKDQIYLEPLTCVNRYYLPIDDSGVKNLRFPLPLNGFSKTKILSHISPLVFGLSTKTTFLWAPS